MDKESIQDLLSELGVSRNTMRIINGWVSAPCPLAPWRHDRGTDRSPSFGVKIQSNGPSNFNCFTCHQRGSLSRLIKEIGRRTGTDLSGLITDTDREELLGGDMPEWGRRTKHTPALGDPVNENVLFAYEAAVGHPYLRARGVPDSIIVQFGLLYDPDDRGVPRILAPVRHVDGKLYGFLGRATTEAQPKVRDYFGLPKRSLVFGMDKVATAPNRRVVLTEGVFDALRVCQHGYKGVAALHSNLTDEQAKILRNNAESVVIMFDNDKAGSLGAKIVTEKLRGYLPLFRVKYPEGVNDPDELTAEEMDRMLRKARMV